MTLRPFPWQTLEPYRRADLFAWRHLKRWAESSLRRADWVSVLEAAMGTSVEFRLREARRCSSSPPLLDGIALDLAATGSSGSSVLLEVEAALATALTARVLKRPTPRVQAALGKGGAETLAGSLGAVVSAVGRRVLSNPLRVRAAGPSAGIRACTTETFESFDSGTFTVIVDDEAYLARISLRASDAEKAERGWNRRTLRRLGVTPIGIPVVVCTVSTTPGEIAALSKGDAWMMGDAPGLKSLRGEAWLVGPDSELGVRAELVDNGRLVLRGGSEALGWSPMIEPDENSPLVEAVGDIPLVVRVEVGTVRMSAREWASLLPGDVVEIARRVGDPVTLRVSGVEVARGELVEIEGAIGVRVLSRLGEDGAR